MFFSEKDKQVYKPDWSKTGFDPLKLESLLVYHTGGALYELVLDRNAATAEPGSPDEGDVSPEGRRKKLAAKAAAELQLFEASKAAFGFDDSVLMAVALERLYDFLEYTGGKGEAPESTPASGASSPDSPSSAPEPTTST